MPTRPCPICAHTAPRYLPATSEHADVNYYRCDPCGHVWSIPKDKPDAPPRHVTITVPRAGSGEGGGGGNSAAS
jgi:hypothetical protein